MFTVKHTAIMLLVGCMTIDALTALVPGAHWMISNEDYATIASLDQPQNAVPSQTDINNWIANCTPPPALQDRVTALETSINNLATQTPTLQGVAIPTAVGQATVTIPANQAAPAL